MQENAEIQRFVTQFLESGSGKTPDIVVLTGAGISAESGLQTFRGAGGLWWSRYQQSSGTYCW